LADNQKKGIKTFAGNSVHSVSNIETTVGGQFALLLVELEEQAIQAAEQIPVEITEIVAGGVAAVVGELDGLPPRAAAALALGAALGTPRREQLELLEPAEKFGG
jgi:hypothetical protein